MNDFKTRVSSISPLVFHYDKGLMLKMSALKLFTVANLSLQPS